LLAAVDRAESGDLATAGRFGDAAIHAQVLHLQAEQSVVGGQHGQAQLLGDSGGDPFVAAAAQRGRRAAVVGDAAVAAAEHQDLNELVEDDPVRDARTVAAERVGVVMGGQQRGELDPQRLEDGRWQGRHEISG
jgi:hypothetical protein